MKWWWRCEVWCCCFPLGMPMLPSRSMQSLQWTRERPMSSSCCLLLGVRFWQQCGESAGVFNVSSGGQSAQNFIDAHQDLDRVRNKEQRLLLSPCGCQSLSIHLVHGERRNSSSCVAVTKLLQKAHDDEGGFETRWRHRSRHSRLFWMRCPSSKLTVQARTGTVHSQAQSPPSFASSWNSFAGRW